MLGVFIYFNCFFNIPHLMMQIPLSSLSVNVLIQIFLLIVHSAAVVLARDWQPTFRSCLTHAMTSSMAQQYFLCHCPHLVDLKITIASWLGPQSPDVAT